MNVQDWITRTRPAGAGRMARAIVGLAALLWASLAVSESSFAMCGDGVLVDGEECDDGENDAGDGCSADCTVEPWIMQVCSTARDESARVTGAGTYVNTYYAAPEEESELAVGATQISLGPARGVSHTLQVGDRLMIIQMQGATIDPSPGVEQNDAYGDGPNDLDRSGYKSITAGTYEMVVVVAAPASGAISLRGDGPGGGLVHNYINSRTVASSSDDNAIGFQTYQAIRIPQYQELTVESGASVIAIEWDGNSGGIVALDVLGTLTLDGWIDVSSRGFRGGRAVTTATDNVDFEMRIPGYKGEGVAGTPWHMHASVNGALFNIDNTGYPTPDNRCVGAPGNAGGNARYGLDAGGGGGGNGGMGGTGGRGRHGPGTRAQGRGGAPLVAEPASLTLGGGGGGSNGNDPLTTEEACSGQSGGGAVLVRAGEIVVGPQGAIFANGDGGAIADSEGGGGGGGGGTIVVYTNNANLTGLTLEANGGDGNDVDKNEDGAGGGGGGGLVYVINSSEADATVNGGAGGVSKSGDDYDGAAGLAGYFGAQASAPAVLACAFDVDTDLDGVLDGDDQCEGGDDAIDTDGDTIPDACDECQSGNMNDDVGTDTDTDGDNVPDACDICPGGNDREDGDMDGVPDHCDMCPEGDDAADRDGDGIADACDQCPDGDGIPDACAAPGGANHSHLTGGACSMSARASGWLWLLFVLAGLALSARRWRITVLASVAAIACTMGDLASAHAQIALDQYQLPAVTDDGVVVATPSTPGHLKLDAQLALNYADDPLVVRTIEDGIYSQRRAIVSAHLVSHLNVSLGLFDRFMVFAGVPVHLAMAGEGPGLDDPAMDNPASGNEAFAQLKADGTSIGDAYLGGRYVIRAGGRVQLAAQVTVSAPTAASLVGAEEMWFAGYSKWAAHPQVVAQARFNRFRVGVNLGVRVHEATQLEGAAGEFGSALTFALGASTTIIPGNEKIRLDGYLEFHGASDLGDFATPEKSPMALLLGAKVHMANGLTLGAGIGPGVQRGIGSPDLRLLWSIGWSGRQLVPDGLRADSDHDGVHDGLDQCPHEAEDRDGIHDDDGCVELDADFDGVLDTDDGEPLKPEDIDGYRDSDGVPDPDNDKDGVPDTRDECPDHAEDVDGVDDEDGCPED